MSQTKALPMINSTNVRSLGCRTLQATNGLLSRLSPPLATRLGMTLFTWPHPSRRPAKEQRWLADAHPFQLEVDGRKLAAWSWGDGPTVLLHHGWGGRGSQLGAFVQPLLQAGYSVVTYDAPAHGKSPGRTTNMVQWSRTIAAASRQLHGLHGIVAHSIGCLATARALHTYHTPVKRLVFLSPPAEMMYFSRMFADLLGFSPEVHDRMWDRWEAELGIDRHEFQIENLAQGQTTPLLVIHDRHDREVSWRSGQRIHNAWQGSQLVTTQHLGHSRIRSAPEVIDRAVSFLGGTIHAGLSPVTVSPQAASGQEEVSTSVATS